MTTKVEVVGASELLRDIESWPDELHDAIAREMRQEVDGLLDHMRGKAMSYSDESGIAVRSLRLSTVGSTLTVAIGGGRGLASTLTYGAEFGGRKKPKFGYVNRSPRGKPYAISRRTTQQFKPHLGRRGYWFWPTVRKDLKGVNSRIRKIIDKVVNS